MDTTITTDQRLLIDAYDALTLLENSPNIIARFDLASRCVYVNTQFEISYGRSRTEILGKTCKEMNFLHAAAAPWTNAIAMVVQSGAETGFEFHMPQPGGKTIYQTSMVPEFDTDHCLIYVLAVAHNITEIRQREAATREREKLISGIIQNTPGMVFQYVNRADSGQYYFTYVSEGSIPLFGLTPAEIMADSHRLEKKFNKPDRKAFLTSMHASLKNMSIWNWEGRAVRRSGAVNWINCRATPRQGEHGHIIWEGVMLDITSSKHTEQQLLNSRQELRSLVAHIDGVRENDRKIIAREMHDELGQALTVIRLKLALLRINFGEKNPALVEQIRLMKIDLDKTSKVMRHVTSTLRPVALDHGLTAGLEWLIEEFSGNTAIRFDLQANLPEDAILDDTHATALFRIVQESLTNIVKHANASAVLVLVSLENNRVHLRIKDNGQGFTMHSGVRLNAFGLIGIQERALMLHGRATIDSEPGRGTVIDVSIPFVTITSREHHDS